MHPARIVIGSDNEKSQEIVGDIYNVLYLIEAPFLFSSIETLELVKNASNAFPATKIAFINEIAGLNHAMGIDVHDIAKVMGMDGRIGKYFLHAGPAFGGSCLRKDTKALVKIGQEHGVGMSIVASIIKANEFQRLRVVHKLELGFVDFKGKVIAVLGFSFKQRTDDVLESSSIPIALSIPGKRDQVKVFDPQTMENAKRLYFADVPSVEGNGFDGLHNGDFSTSPFKIMYCVDEYDAAVGTDAIVILTE
jgi:UDPglucose 6-dehydrogenase